MTTADEELAEIEWAAGLIPMPPHLIAAGTRVCRYTSKIIRNPNAPPIEARWISEAASLSALNLNHYIEVPLPRPIVETYVWGELVSRVIE